tara:strand:+ start:8708 stop:8908 length:201 start_codon:yes stop_codon:yes gene_type:complete
MSLINKVINISYLDSVIGDLECRIEKYKNGIEIKETVKEREETIKEHIRNLNTVKDYIYELHEKRN